MFISSLSCVEGEVQVEVKVEVEVEVQVEVQVEVEAHVRLPRETLGLFPVTSADLTFLTIN